MMKLQSPSLPTHQGSRWRKINFLKAIQNEVEMVKTPSPSPFSYSQSIQRYFLYRVQYQIHESFVSSKYNREFSNRDYVVTDNTKVVGYLINGYYFNFKYLYGV